MRGLKQASERTQYSKRQIPNKRKRNKKKKKQVLYRIERCGLLEQKIVLDDKSFKALSSDSRVGILKSLGERRRTLSELSQKLDLGNSTVKEHCDILIDAELIKLVDEGRKWKYYQLTQKGKQIIMPGLMDEVRVLIVLCLGVIAIGGITFFAMQTLSAGSGAMATQFQNSAPMLDSATEKMLSTAADINAATGAGITNTAQINGAEIAANCIIKVTQGITPDLLILVAALGVIVGAVASWLLLRRN